MAKDNLADQTNNVLKIVIKEKPSLVALPERTNNWMSVQGGGDWEGLSKDQIHKRQLKFDSPEYGIRAGAISIMTRALRKNNKPEINISQIFFEDDGWAEDKESYKMFKEAHCYGEDGRPIPEAHCSEMYLNPKHKSGEGNMKQTSTRFINQNK